MNNIKIFVFSFFCIALLFLSGCATNTTSRGISFGKGGTTAPALGVAPILQFDDVPVPVGFKMIERESFAFQNDVSRVALLKYAGAKIPDRIVWFYQEQMPLYNWGTINIIEYERKILNFENNKETCIVTIDQQMRKSIITIAISPKSKPMDVKSEK